MATTTYRLMKPRDVVPGVFVRFNVPIHPWRTDVYCEVVQVEKVQRDGTLKYAITVIEPRDRLKVPSGQSATPRKSTRYVTPFDTLRVRDSHE